jgi:hypothetical protein
MVNFIYVSFKAGSCGITTALLLPGPAEAAAKPEVEHISRRPKR